MKLQSVSASDRPGKKLKAIWLVVYRPIQICLATPARWGIVDGRASSD